MATRAMTLQCMRQCRLYGTRNKLSKITILENKVRRKMKRGVDRLPSEGKDPASEFKHGWRLATAAVLERYPVIIPEPDPFEAEYLKGRFLDEQKRSRPIAPEWFLTEKDKLEGRC